MVLEQVLSNISVIKTFVKRIIILIRYLKYLIKCKLQKIFIYIYDH